MAKRTLRWKIFYEPDTFAFWQETSTKDITIISVTPILDPSSPEEVSAFVTYYEE